MVGESEGGGGYLYGRGTVPGTIITTNYNDVGSIIGVSGGQVRIGTTTNTRGGALWSSDSWSERTVKLRLDLAQLYSEASEVGGRTRLEVWLILARGTRVDSALRAREFHQRDNVVSFFPAIEGVTI